MEALLNKIIALVKDTGSIMTEAHRSRDMISEKEGNKNFVTTFDKKVQEKLISELSVIMPEAKFVAEEKENDFDIKYGFTFVIDPIDGTSNFIKDLKMSAISIGLLRDGNAVLGVVYNPYTNELFTALEGKGAYLNGERINVSKEESIENSIVLFGTAPYYEEYRHKSFLLAEKYCEKAIDVRRMGAASLDLCYVAAGRAELYFEYLICPWDHAAGAFIVKEAGGVVTTMDGQPMSYTGKCSVLAYNGRVEVLS